MCNLYIMVLITLWLAVLTLFPPCSLHHLLLLLLSLSLRSMFSPYLPHSWPFIYLNFISLFIFLIIPVFYPSPLCLYHHLFQPRAFLIPSTVSLTPVPRLSLLAGRFGCLGKQHYHHWCLLFLNSVSPSFLSLSLSISLSPFSIQMSCFHCALKRGCECAAATIPHNNTLGGIQLENYTSSVLLAEVILHTNTHIHTQPSSIKQPL